MLQERKEKLGERGKVVGGGDRLLIQLTKKRVNSPSQHTGSNELGFLCLVLIWLGNSGLVSLK